MNCENNIQAKVSQVRGNVLRVAVPLQVEIATLEDGRIVKRTEDFTPSPSYPVTVTLFIDAKNYRYTPETSGNVVTFEDLGTLPVGNYNLEIKCKDEHGAPMRFMARDAVEIVDATADAGFLAGVEFDAETQTLLGAVFYAVGSGGGGGFTEETDPVFAASPAAGISAEDIDNWNDKQDAIQDLDAIRAGAALGATALQSYTETDPTVPSWAKQPSKPTYTPQEVGALPADTPIPTKTSDLTNDSGFLTQHQDISGKANTEDLADVAFSGSYDDLEDKPTIPAAQVQSDWSQSDTSAKDYIKNKPTIPAAQVNADWNANSGVAQILNKPTIPTVPTNVSAFTNDAGYLTQHQDISGKADKVMVIDVASTGDVSQLLAPNTFYIFGSIDSLALTLTAGTGFVMYAGKFTASANWGGTGLSVPATVTEATGNDTVEAGKVYEFSILDNVIVVKEVA